MTKPNSRSKWIVSLMWVIVGLGLVAYSLRLFGMSLDGIIGIFGLGVGIAMFISGVMYAMYGE